MAVLMEERTRVFPPLDTRPGSTVTSEQFGREEDKHWLPLSWLSAAGEVVLGLVLALLGLLMSVTFLASLIAVSFIAVALTVLFFALAIQAAPILIPVVLGLLLLALAMEAAGWWSNTQRA
jgi:hypothetical protein